MKNSLAVGLLLVLLGAAILAWPVVTYTDRDTVVDLGPLEVTQEDQERIALPPVLGGAVIVAGLAFIIFGARQRRA
jgi:hypothetical protein